MAPKDKDFSEKTLPHITEVIIVEGRDDTAAIKRAVRAVTIETHGFGISKTTWDKIKSAHEGPGIIVFTDPDHAGEEIRRKILESFPDAKQAFLSREKAGKFSGEEKLIDIGIENASPEAIREALEKAKANIKAESKSKDGYGKDEFSGADLERAGLTGSDGSKERREKLGDILGIGYANGKNLLYKLNTLGITREAFEEAVKKL